MDRLMAIAPSEGWFVPDDWTTRRMSLGKRKLLLTAFVLVTAVCVLLYALRWGSFDNPTFWYVVILWTVVFIVAAVKNHGWNVEEGQEPRGFEVIPHDKDEP